MQSETNILIELKEISPVLAAMPKLNVFTVPDGYFDNLPLQLLNVVQEEISSRILLQASRQNQGEVPAGYFDNLAGHILGRIKALQEESASEEINHLSPLLQSLQHKNVFEVPVGYFEQLAGAVINRLKSGNIRVVVMRRRMVSFSKYAVAAVFTGVMALGVIKFTQPANVKLDATVLNGLQINKEHSFDQEFDKVADDDIIKYLQANGENVDAQTVAYKTLNENELPSQEDYLNDDKALDNYLDNTNIEKLNN